MSYPYTKPQSRYPHRRKHFTASYPSPMGEDTFSRGVFTPYNPWATPNYVRSEPDGVNGFGDVAITGAAITPGANIGAAATSEGSGSTGEYITPCSGPKIRMAIAQIIYDNLPGFITAGFDGMVLVAKAENPVGFITGELTIPSFRDVIYNGLSAVQVGMLNEMQKLAEKGGAAFNAYFTANIAPKVAGKLNSSIVFFSESTGVKLKITVQASHLSQLGPIVEKGIKAAMAECRKGSGLFTESGYTREITVRPDALVAPGEMPIPGTPYFTKLITQKQNQIVAANAEAAAKKNIQTVALVGAAGLAALLLLR